MGVVRKILEVLDHVKRIIPGCELFPGVEREQIEAVFSELGVEPNSDLIELYGVVHNLDGALSFLSLKEASTSYLAYREFSEEDLPWWPSLFPVVDMNGDLQVCVDLETDELYLIDIENGSTRRICRDYRKLLDALLEAFELRIHSRESVSGSLVLEKRSWKILKAKHGVQ